MSDSRTTEEARAAFQTCKSPHARDRAQFYDMWAKNYETDCSLMSYRAPHLAVNFLSENFTGSPGDVLVLDVACGTGWVAKLMFELGFRHFVGVDGSKGMLDRAAETGLYQDLKLALLGTDPLPAQTGVFDVVIIVGALCFGFIPVSVVRELCHAAKPGALVCIARGNHTGTESKEYKKDLERELQLMEDEGLWSGVGLKQADEYMQNSNLSPDRDEDEQLYISGTIYLYKKSSC
ncbi:methyltransferase-like protein 27 [Hippoglossus stenolepis]|uniref:methyltransferase-like protein 27 n=1 Tax=Hippoglossus stenolepis TaxID=195615 RepID=UPI00159CB758|nr:methyltransferase-like protein 27 [Hippoglossus stenolepis]